jgi:hypothetical protein
VTESRLSTALPTTKWQNSSCVLSITNIAAGTTVHIQVLINYSIFM